MTISLFGQPASLAKNFRAGTHRLCSPAETVARYRPLGAQIGLTRLANITGLDVIGLPVWVAIRPNARGLATSQGKGLTHDAARASALMESIETWHAETIARAVVVDSAAALRRRATVAETDALSFYEDSPPRADTPIPWIEGWDLIGERPCWVPLETVSTNYVVSAQRTAATSFVQSSNGLAGGNHPLEAVSHALAELIERDSLTLAGNAFRRLDPALRLSLASIDDPDCRTILDRLESAGVQAALFDLTSDLGVPTYGCTIVDADERLRWRMLPPFTGYGCHPQPAIAALRAMTEAVQSRLTYISGSRDDISPAEYRRGGNPDDLASVRARLATGGQRRLADRADLSTDSFDGDVVAMLKRLRAGGVEQVVAVDLSRPECGVPVVKLVVPRLAAPVTLIRGRAIRAPSRVATIPMEAVAA